MRSHFEYHIVSTVFDRDLDGEAQPTLAIVLVPWAP
jgi:hypothetical protein